MNRTTCSSCGNQKLYRLADGRRKCALCGLKFPIRTRQSRLKPSVRRRLLQCFWEGDSAQAASRKAGVDPKTAQAHYRRARAAIDRLSRFQPPGGNPEPRAPSGGPIEPRSQRVPVFGIWESPGAIGVLMPGEAATLGGARNASISWVYAPNPQASLNLELNSFFRIARQGLRLWHGKAQINRADIFWSFARGRLKAYRGGYRSHFAAFLKEMAYRFNARTSPRAFGQLADALAR